MPTLDEVLQDAVARRVRHELNGIRKELAALRKAVAQAAGRRRTAGSLKAPRIRAIREKLGVSQALFARMAGVSAVAVYFWESGRTTPSLERERRFSFGWRRRAPPRLRRRRRADAPAATASSPSGIRTRVTAVKGRCPDP